MTSLSKQFHDWLNGSHNSATYQIRRLEVEETEDDLAVFIPVERYVDSSGNTKFKVTAWIQADEDAMPEFKLLNVALTNTVNDEEKASLIQELMQEAVKLNLKDDLESANSVMAVL